MYRKPMKLNQAIISTSKQIVYECPIDSRCQILEIWINNTSETVTSKVTIHAHGIESENVLIQNLEVNPKSTKLIEDCRIILEQGEKIYITSSSQNVTSITMYGVLEGEISIND